MAAPTKPELQSFLVSVQLCMAKAAAYATAAADDQRRQGPSSLPSKKARLCNKKAGRSGFLGVTKHKRTQRHEAHVWVDKKQVYLGAYDVPEQAACGHDIAALRSRGDQPRGADELNFPAAWYQHLEPMLLRMPQAEVVATLRSFSKSLKPRSFGRGGGSQAGSQAGSRASSAGEGGDSLSSGVWGGGPATIPTYDGGSEGRLGSTLCHVPTRTSSIANPDSLNHQQRHCHHRHHHQQQHHDDHHHQQAMAVAQNWLAVSSAMRPRRRPTARHAASGQEAASGLVLLPLHTPEPAGSTWGRSGAAQPLRRLPTQGAAVSALPGSTGAWQPGSPLKIAALQRTGTASPRGNDSFTLLPAAEAVSPPAVATPPPLPHWPHTRALPAFSPPLPACADPLSRLPLLPSLRHHPQLHALQPGQAAGPLVPLLPPVVASRAVRELASIHAALRPLAATAQ